MIQTEIGEVFSHSIGGQKERDLASSVFIERVDDPVIRIGNIVAFARLGQLINERSYIHSRNGIFVGRGHIWRTDTREILINEGGIKSPLTVCKEDGPPAFSNELVY